MGDDPLNILLTDPHLNGGGQVRYLTNLAAQLVRRGHRVTIGCRPNSVLIESARQAGCDAYPEFPFRGGLRPRAWSGDVQRLRAYIQHERPDIVHANLSQDHWSCGVANRLMGFPVCLVRTRHNTYPVRDNYLNRVLNRHWTDYQIVVCDTVRQTLAKQSAFDADRLCAIHNGVDAELFKPNEDARARVRAEFGYGAGDLVLGIAARLVPAKGHEFLLRAVADVADEFPALRVLVLGQGELDASLRTLARDLGIEARVTFAGFREDMAACTQAFDIGVQPSIDCDTSSFSLKEQMAAEKPVIASDYGGLTEIVTHGIEGFVVPQGTVEPLAGAIAKLAGNPMLRAKMGAAGRARVLRDFTVEVFAERTEAAYRTALELHRHRRNGR
jgi:glycosyltransferase involved in cell wall biosynthesis